MRKFVWLLLGWIGTANGAVWLDDFGTSGAGGGRISDLASSSLVTATRSMGGSQGETLEAVRWHGFYAGNNAPAADSFRIAGWFVAPGSRPSYPSVFDVAITVSSRTPTGVNTFGFDVYEFVGTVSSPVSIESVSWSLVSIYADTSGDEFTNNFWYWHRTSQSAGPDYYSVDPQATSGLAGFSQGNSIYSLELSGVPEPQLWLSLFLLTPYLVCKRHRN